MPIYVESRDLDANGGFVAEHQYLIHVPDGQEFNYDAWLYIGAFPSNGEGSLMTRFGGDGDVLFAEALADRWTLDEFYNSEPRYISTNSWERANRFRNGRGGLCT